MRLVWIDELGNEHQVATPEDITRWISANRYTWSRDLAYHTIRTMGEARLETLHNGNCDPAIH